MPTSSTTASRTITGVQEEQHHLDRAERTRHDLLEELRQQLAVPPRDRTDAHRHAMLATRRRALADADSGLVLGRIDTAGGDAHRIGRVGIPAADGGEPLVLDWRADAARPFYTATAVQPEGLVRRRHIRTSGNRVTGIDDEELGSGGSGDPDLVGEAALLAALDERRTGHMGTAVATLQREQDAIVRDSADTALVVQGGPGTGKTVVALHRVAYLLFARPEIARRGVLLLGPSRRFLTYVEQVLPALGETAVVAATCDTVLPGAHVERDESREVAEIKGRSCWWSALRARVEELVPSVVPLTLVLDGERYLVPPSRLDRAVRAAHAGDRSLLQARAHVFAALRDWLIEAVVDRQAALLASMEDGFEDILGRVDSALERADDRGVRTAGRSAAVDGEMSEGDIEDLRERVLSDGGVTDTLERWWPAPDPRALLADLLHDRELLTRLVGLAEREIEAVVTEPGPLSSSDVALLDALIALIGTVATPADEEAPFLADRAAADPTWTYGHVVVDEAQELSAMQWHMVRRRCPLGSITAVGDIDQASSPHRHTTWEDALSPALGARWRRSDLTICYRTPREVMALVPPVLERAGSHNQPPRAVRSSGHEPRRVTAVPATIAATVSDQVRLLGKSYGDSIGIVTAAEHVAALRTALPDLPVLAAVEAKGLEWDACVVVDPDGIAAAPRGWNALYVALTRCTQELVQVTVR